jgi:hypothetical protein
MKRTPILSLLLLAAVRVAAGDDAATAPSTPATQPSTPALAANAPAMNPSAHAARQTAKKQFVSTKAGESKADAAAEPGEAAAQPGGDVKMSGMSILGNEDAPKSLVLVPWKSSQLADMPNVSRLLDSSMQPVDKDVFMRELSYYEFKSGSK